MVKNKMKKNLLLVRASKNPKHLYFGKSSQLRVPPLGLGVVAALTPDNWNVTIVDESDIVIYFQFYGLITGR